MLTRSPDDTIWKMNNALHITEEQVRELLPVHECIEVLRRAFSLEYVNIPRYRLKSRNSLLHVMSASVPELGIIGLKTYTTTASGNTFVVLLFDEANGALKAIVEADALGRIRTGAASGLATDLLAAPVSRIGAVIGTGIQGETQLLAIDTVREFEEIRIYSRKGENRAAFVERMRGRTRSPVIAHDSAEACVRDADVICTITSSRQPVLQGEWLKPGCHINAAGVNWANKREIDETAVGRCDLIAVDSIEQSKIEAGDLIQVPGFDWTRVCELSDIVTGKVARSSPDQITLFKSNGIALEDIAAADYLLSRMHGPSRGADV